MQSSQAAFSRVSRHFGPSVDAWDLARMARSRSSFIEILRNSDSDFMGFWFELWVKKYSHGLGFGVWLHHAFTSLELYPETVDAAKMHKNTNVRISTRKAIIRPNVLRNVKLVFEGIG